MGDEFMSAVGFNDESVVANSLYELKNTLNKPIEIRNEFVIIDVCIGVSIYPNDSKSLEKLNSFSDMAMYSIKGNETLDIAFYKKQLKTQALRKKVVKECLKEAIENVGFVLLYQPIIDVAKNSIDNYEALIWFKNHNIFPDEFIPIAETTGLIFLQSSFTLM